MSEAIVIIVVVLSMAIFAGWFCINCCKEHKPNHPQLIQHEFQVAKLTGIIVV